MINQINVGVIGTGWCGGIRANACADNPLVDKLYIAESNKERLQELKKSLKLESSTDNWNELIDNKNIDTIIISATPETTHFPMALAALKAGKNVMCTVPMSTSIEECKQIVGLVKETGLKYMMAETVVYSREFLFIKEMYEKGEMGNIQFMQASHPQDMEGWPEYWEKMIPMHYATHVVSPVLGLVDGKAEYVSSFGSGSVNDDIAKKSNNSYSMWFFL